MFTGIIENKAKILAINAGRFTIKNCFSDPLSIWQSIAHDGACMTIEKFDASSYSFFVMEESLTKTNFPQKKVWDYFNVERCMLVGSRIDWHFVSGHIDCTWILEEREEVSDGSYILSFTFPHIYSTYLIQKGSISINWISLTVMRNSEWKVSVSIIPHTWECTNLREIMVWDMVNLEFDMLWKYILNSVK